MKAYRIRDWNKHFENNRTRSLKRLDWVPFPNRMDGDGYTELLDHEDGMTHFAAWVLIVEVASKCEIRGTLMRGPDLPHDSNSLARISRGRSEVFEAAISRLLVIGWMEEVECANSSPDNTYNECGHDPAPKCGETAPSCVPPAPQCASSIPFRTIPFPSLQGGVGGCKVKEPPTELEFPQILRTPEFSKVWEKWVLFRKKKKSCKDWIALFQEQLNWLGTFPELTSTQMLEQSIRGDYQGIFELKQNENNHRNSTKSVVDERNARIVGADATKRAILAECAQPQRQPWDKSKPVAEGVVSH